MPEMGESVTEGTVLEWHKQEGEFVEEGETVVEVSTDKVDAEVPAPASGTITKTLAQPDETVQIGQVLAEMAPGASQGGDGRTSGGAAVQPAEPAAPPASQPAGTGAEGEASGGVIQEASGGVVSRVSPVARRIAAASGVDLGAVQGSGPGGKVTKADVLAAADGKGQAPAVAPAAKAAEVKPLRGPAAMLAQAMNESRSMPTATSFRTLPVDVLDAKRKALNGVLKDRGMKVSFTHLVAWAIVQAAKEWPAMARVYEEQDGKPQVVEPGGVHLGIAVDVERKGTRSLMVPCIKGAQALDFASFHTYYEELITKTRENKLTADDFQGTNVTLTNPGGLGTVASVPRLLKGQGTIVATGSIAYPVEWAHTPAEKIKALGISKVMTMTSTYDHRIIQGAESGSFLRRIDELLQGEDAFYETGRRVARPLPHRHRQRLPRLGLGAAAGHGRSARPACGPGGCPARQRAAPGRAGCNLAAQGLPHPRAPGGPPRPAGQGAEGRSGDRAREPQSDPRADGEDPRLDSAVRGRGRDAARGPASDARGVLRHDRLPDRAPLLAPAADVAAGDDRDGGAPHAAELGGEARSPVAARRRCSSSSASSRRPTWARSCSRSRASTQWSR